MSKFVRSGIVFLIKENFRDLGKKMIFFNWALWLELVLNVAWVGMSEHAKCTAELGINGNSGSVNETKHII